jgi:DNA-binding PadR family transcriptional regulator
VSPVFRHGLLRLYLLKLLDEAPRHGYDVIRLLQDRFLGVYSPSPGTIYPRLARLEEEGLVTHDVIDGKKVYRITDAGRDELNSRLDDLAELEDQLSASVRDIAREISRDVRETVRNLRDELTWAVREAGRAGREATDRDSADDERGDRVRSEDAGRQTRRRPPADWREWANWHELANWADRPDWREWAHWARQQDWSDWPGLHEWREHTKTAKQDWKEQAQAWKGQAKANKQEWRERAKAGRPGPASDKPCDAGGPDRPRRSPDRDLATDLEHLAGAFATQIRGLARHAEAISDEAVISLGKILGDALSRITTEVFGPHGPGHDQGEREQAEPKQSDQPGQTDQPQPREQDPRGDTREPARDRESQETREPREADGRNEPRS